MSPAALRLLAALVVALSVSGCISDASLYDEGDDEPSGSTSDAVGTRWQPPQTRQVGTYQDAPAWNGGRNCAGGLKPGARVRGDQIKAKFALANVDGYACRPNTANSSQLSMHGTGRALDIFVSGAKGDRVASYIVENANALGFQLVIWNRTLWKVTSGGGSSRAYTGPNPHTDHVHAELTAAAASSASSPAPTGDDGSADPTAGDPPDTTPPASNTTPPAGSSGTGGGASCAGDGACNPGNDGSGLICVAGRCVPGCRQDNQCPGIKSCISGQCR